MQACRIFSIAGIILMISFWVGHIFLHNPLDSIFIASLLSVAAIVVTSLGMIFKRSLKPSRVRR
jgi:hypothetical protein